MPFLPSSLPTHLHPLLTLESSTANLKSTSTTHDVLDSLMTTSKHLITALEKSDWMDRMLIFAGLAFFVLVVLFIIKQRLVDRGLRVAFFWTRFLPDFGGDEALLAAADSAAGERLAVVLLGHTNWDVRAAAARVLADSGNPDFLPPMLSALASEWDPLARRALVDAVERLSGR